MKAQEAMEYLITYGWALAIIVIVLGVVTSFLPNFNTIEYCTFNKNIFNCKDFLVYKKVNSEGKEINYVNLRFIYNGPDAIKVTDLACVKKGEDYNLRLLGNSELGGKYIFLTGETGEIKSLPCGFTDGKVFEGSVVLKYYVLDNPNAFNFAIANIKSTVSTT